VLSCWNVAVNSKHKRAQAKGNSKTCNKALGHKAITRKPTMAQYCAAVDGVSHGRQQHSVEEPK